MSFHARLSLQINFICLYPDHYWRAAWIFGAISALRLTQRFKNLKEASYFFILGDSLLVQSMESIMNSENLIENGCLRWHE
jgi:hypothetical protein